MPAPGPGVHAVDVRDLAALHVACAEQPGASGRYFGVRSYRWAEVLVATSFAARCGIDNGDVRFAKGQVKQAFLDAFFTTRRSSSSRKSCPLV